MEAGGRYGFGAGSGDSLVDEGLLAALVEGTEQCLAIVNEEGRCVYANPAMQALTGFDPEELCAQPLLDLLHPLATDGRAFSREDCLPLHAQGDEDAMLRRECLFRRKDHVLFLAIWSAKAVARESAKGLFIVQIHTHSFPGTDKLQQLKAGLTYRFATEMADVGVWESDLATEVLELCPVSATILGLQPHQARLPVSDFLDLIHADDLPLFSERLRIAVEQGKSFELELRIQRSDEQIRWIAMHGIVIRNDQGSATRLVGTLFDVIHEKQLEEATATMQLTYLLASEAAGIGTWERSYLDGTSTISPVAARILHLPEQQTVLQPSEWQRMIVPEDWPLLLEAGEEALYTDKPFNLDYRVRLQDGSIIWISSRGVMTRNSDGRPFKALGVMMDITEKKRLDDDLRQTNHRLSLILETSGEGIFGLDSDYRCTFVNSAGAAMLGYEAAELIDRQIHPLIHHHYPDGAVYPLQECFVAKAIDSGKAARIENEVFWRKDGTCFPVSYSVSPRKADGARCGAVIVFSDITQRRRIEEQEKKAAADAQARAEANAKFSAFFYQNTSYAGLLELDGTMVEANRISLEACGYAPENVIGKKFWECGWWSPSRESMNTVRQGCEEAAAGRRFQQELMYFMADGSMRITDLTLAPVLTDDGKTLYIAASGTDITDRKHAEKALKAREERYRALFDSVEDAFCIAQVMVDECGHAYDVRIEEVNSSFKKHTGLVARSGQTAREVLPHFGPRGAEFYARVVTSGESAHVIDYSSTLDRWLDLSAIRVGDASDRRVAVLFKDISEQKQAIDALRTSEERYRLLTELSPDAILVELNGEYVYANSSAVSLFEVEDPRHLVGRRAEEFIEPEFHKIAEAHRSALLNEEKKTALLELRIRRSGGALVDVEAVFGMVQWEGMPALQILMRDVTELKRTKETLRFMSERLKLAIEGTGEGIWDWNIRNNTYTFAGGLNRILGDAEESSAREAIRWQDKIHPDDRARVITTFQGALEDKTPIYECEYRLRDNAGQWRWLWARGMIVERDDDGKPLTMTGTLADITIRKESEDLAWRHANLDALTGLPSRRLFHERLEMEVARSQRTGHSLALLFMDLDGFKYVNDVFGHEAGDVLLMEVAARLKSCVRQTDTVARLGGDEFTVILTELEDMGHVEFVCQKILASLAEPFHIGKDTAYVSGSIGVGLYPFDAKDPEDLTRKADQAMYAAKNAGKNQFHYFTREMDDRAHNRLKITNELHHAMRGNQLSVHYQPVLDLRSGKVVKAEALLRWHHPELGEISPDEFIPLAEESGLIQKIGNWVFREAAVCCKMCWEQGNTSFQIGVNKSPMEFMAREAGANWLQYLADLGLACSSISVEITEGSLLHSSRTVEDKLHAYQQAGIELALDDFGTGYSSMAYLHKFNIDYVKIDQSFIRDIATDPGCRAIAEAIITMAHKLGKKVIAEGIETEEQREFLMQAGCDYGQGFLFSPAVPAEQLLAIVAHDSFSLPQNVH